MNESAEIVTLPKIKGQRKKTQEQCFWAKVDKNGPVPTHNPELGNCWQWIGAKSPDGYGKITKFHKPTRAHRFSWVIHNGPILNGLFVLHKCDNPPCVNPHHLELGDNSKNMKDMYLRGRAPKRAPRKKVGELAVKTHV